MRDRESKGDCTDLLGAQARTRRHCVPSLIPNICLPSVRGRPGLSWLLVAQCTVGSLKSSRLCPPGAGSDTVCLHFSTPGQALTAPPTKRCCGSTATTSRLPWGPASSPSLGSGTLSDVTNGELPISWANKPQLSISLSQPSAPHPHSQGSLEQPGPDEQGGGHVRLHY